MKLKNTNKNFYQPVPEQHYKKPYLLRKVKELEAKEEIKEYDGRDEGSGYAASHEYTTKRPS